MNNVDLTNYNTIISFKKGGDSGTILLSKFPNILILSLSSSSSSSNFLCIALSSAIFSNRSILFGASIISSFLSIEIAESLSLKLIEGLEP